MKYDLIVVGAGPAGCVAASVGASKGLKVLVLEERDLGWEKPCAGGISPRGVSEFKIPPSVFDRYAGDVYICSPSAKGVKINLKGAKGGLCMRAKLDSWLVDQAKDKGAEFRPRTAVTKPIMRSGAVIGVKAKTSGSASKDFLANVVVAADGTPSDFAKSVGDLDATNVGAQASCYQYQMEMSDEKISELVGDCIELYFGSKWAPGGYSWIFPKRGVVSVGNIVWMDQFAKSKPDLKSLLDSFIRTHPIASKKLASAKVMYPQTHMIGFWGVVKKHVGNGYMIVGDAGGFVSYVTGEGIYYSMCAGRYAAETAVAASEKGVFTEAALDGFNAKVNGSAVGGDMTAGVALKQMFLDDDVKQEMSISTAIKDTKFADMIGGLIAGLVPYTALAPKNTKK
jgi:digeranylgeranylglycerophospholipid reductase